jgi:biopolymer transport protein TolR
MSSPGHRHRTPLVHKKPAAGPGVRSEINVTPLVDVCLVLLIIFMVVLDKLARGMEVNLPKTQHHRARKDTGEDLIISIMRDGSKPVYYWDRDQIRDLDTLREKVAEDLKRKQRDVFLKGDMDMPYKDIYPVFIAVHEAGAQNVLLGTAELKKPGGEGK